MLTLCHQVRPPTNSKLLYNFQTESGQQDPPPDEDEQPLVCMICEDKATGLHYGIITCEG